MKSIEDLLSMVPTPAATPEPAPEPTPEAAPEVAPPPRSAPPGSRPPHALLRAIAVEGQEACNAAWRAEHDRLVAQGGGTDSAPSVALCAHIVGDAGATVREAMFAPDHFHLNASFTADDCAGLRAEWAPQWLRWRRSGRPAGLTRNGDDGFLLRWGRERGPSGAIAYLPLIAGQKSWLILSDDSTKDMAHELVRVLVLRLACMMTDDVRFSLLDPVGLGRAFAQQTYLPSCRPVDSAQPANALATICNDLVDATRTMLQGRPDFHSWTREEQKLAGGYEVVCALDVGDPKYDALSAKLREIALNGPPVGRYLVAHVNVTPPAHQFGARGDGVEKLPQGFDDVRKGAHVIDLRTLAAGAATGAGIAVDRLPPAPLHTRILQSLARPVKGSSFAVIPPVSKWWTHRAVHFIQTPLTNTPDGPSVLFGEEPDGLCRIVTAGVLAGQTGSGKSKMLEVLIFGLAMRYSPDELQFYLVDLKDGTEFNIYRQMPHTAVIATSTALPYVGSLLENLDAEMTRRNIKLFRDNDDGHGQFKNITAYHNAGQPRGPAPRLLIVIDEYQVMFRNADQAPKISKVIQNLVAKGRSAGIHILLSSQSMKAPGMTQGRNIFSNIALRMSMKLSGDAIEGLEEFNREGKALLRSMVRERGDILVNSDGGKDGNVVGHVDLLDGRSDAEINAPGASQDDNARLAPLFAKFDELARRRTDAQKAHWPRLEVIDGLTLPTLSGNFLLQRMQATGAPLDAAALEALAAQRPEEKGLFPVRLDAQIHPVPLLLGRDTSLHGQASAVLWRGDGENLLSVVKDSDLQGKLLAGIIVSLASLAPSVVGSVRILNTALYADTFRGVIDAAIALTGRPMPAHWVVSENAADAKDFLEARAPDGSADVLLLIGPDQAPDLRVPDTLAARSAGNALSKRLGKGPETGQHTIMLCNTMAEVGKVFQARANALGETFHWIVYDILTRELARGVGVSTPTSRSRDDAEENVTTVNLMGPSQERSLVTLFGE